MTWNDLKSRVTKPFGGNYGSDAEVFLEDAEKDLGLFAKCYERTFVTLLDEHKNGFALPSDFIEMSGRPDYAGDLLDRYQEVGYASNKQNSTQYETGTPQFYRIVGKRMELIPQPTDAKLLRFNYVALPKKHTKSSAYRGLNYKDLSGQSFQVGDHIEGRLSTNLGTATNSAIIIDVDHNGDGTGTLTLKDVTDIGSYTGFQSGDTLVTIDAREDAFTAATPYGSGYSMDQLVQNWDTLGFGGKATAVGTDYAFTGTSNSVSYGEIVGTSPVIPEPFHYLMIEYAQARIYDMLGQSADADRSYSRYYSNRMGVAAIVANQDFGGPVTVVDAL